MSNEPHKIFLIDLSKQFPFQIGNEQKSELCFRETLIISCAHCEDIGEGDSDSEWTCSEPSDSKDNVKEKKEDSEETNDIETISENVSKRSVYSEEEDFHFYFFPDCEKPYVQGSNDSILLKDGIPTINPLKQRGFHCTCSSDGSLCKCFVQEFCECGKKPKDKCSCDKLDAICICDEKELKITCTCKPSLVCLCASDGKIQPKCTCIAEVDEKSDNEEDKQKVLKENIVLKCSCPNIATAECNCNTVPEQDVNLKCSCPNIAAAECNCNTVSNQDIQLKCSCPNIATGECNCNNIEQDVPLKCSCSNITIEECERSSPPEECTCGDTNDCKCSDTQEKTSVTHESGDACVCDTPSENTCDCDPCACAEISDPCICDKDISEAQEKPTKLVRKRAGKHGHRWCHQVDPRHTYFDYAYDRHDKIDYKVPEKEKFKILGLHDEIKSEIKVETEEITVPIFKRKVRKPSLDCCSAVGGISISVEVLGEEKDKFLVQVVSNSSKEGAKCGSKLISIMDCKLHTLEENRTEHITRGDVTKERRSYMTICESGYYNKVTRICGERNLVKRIYHSFDDAHNFLLEGANVVLLRYFAINRYKGRVKTDTVLINGTICESVYVCLGVSQAIVNGKPLFIAKVERHIIEPSGFIHQTLTVLTLRGYIVTHEWADNCYIFHLNPLLRVNPEKDEIESHEPLREKWRDDLQLLSDYLEFKSTRTSEGGLYALENRELTGVIRDYLQTLLLLRPQNAMDFTREYFGATLQDLDLPHNEFFNPTHRNVRYYFYEN
ncbi:uncharacterized protein LOC121739877 [Aricia agestis]|uniref:uncharacterized protein LOC121739877 n=1 Tax=Aricia agestis TaxID=91739 RepID=UPI001C20AE7B|nr:uncharacterized protein LOC121739877 [Aricia agestis]